MMMKNNHFTRCLPLRFFALLFISGVLLLLPFITHAATLSLSPSSGVYTAGATFNARVVVNTGGEPINSAEATLKFNPNELSVVSVNRSGSIFTMWPEEPSFSNSAGTIAFAGGNPSGYSGSAGTIMNITFRTKGAGTARVNLTSGLVLANDGRGTNILTSMPGGTFTVQAVSTSPEPEIIEYVAPANTPAAPNVQSASHPDASGWYDTNTASLSWNVPSDVTSVRTLLDQNPTSVPTRVYETPINSIEIPDLDEGVSYFHIQFRNADGWGRVSHYRLAVDTENPSSIDIYHPEGANLANPVQVVQVDVEDDTSTVNEYSVKIDDGEPFNFVDETGSSTITLPTLEPGYHSLIIEAFDEAGNSIVGTYSFTIESFDKPTFTEYPSQINEEVIPVIKGMTRPNAEVEVTLQKIGGEPIKYQLNSAESGVFTFIPEGTFTNGVYELSAIATDEFGAKSEVSDTVRIAVQQPGYIRIGSFIVSLLSVLVPLIALVIAFFLGFWYLIFALKRFRKKVRVESTEALDILHREFASLQTILRKQEAELQDARKTKKLTKAEANMVEVIDRALQDSQKRVEKEIEDVAELTQQNDKD